MRTNIVAKAERSDAAKGKQQPAAPTTVCRSTASAACSPISPPTAGSRRPPRHEKYLFTLHTRPTPIQSRAFELLAVTPTVPSNRPSLSINDSEINGLQS